MSHYLCAVLTTYKPNDVDFERIMHPFDENYRYLPNIEQTADIDDLEVEYAAKTDQYPDFESFLLQEYGYDYCDEEDRVVGYWFNPHAKWDWYDKGGRWVGLIKNNGSKLKDVDFAKRVFEENPRPYAFIDPDGHWHEPGRMGWFGVSNATNEGMTKYDAEWDEMLKNHGDDYYCTILDCHI